MQTYFTFPDGGLSYDCPRCGQQCCRGKGFALGAEQLVPLLLKAPELAPLVRLSRSVASAVNLSDGCWFLDDKGWCSIETRHGREVKPSTCRLFPFNRVFRVGDVRVVDVNSVICPVEAAGGGGVRHAEISAEIEALAGSPLIDAPAPLPPGLAPDWLDIESKASAASAAHAGDPDALAAALGETDTRALVSSWARFHNVDIGEIAAREAEVAPRVALIAPSLRWNFLFRRNAAPYPQVIAYLARRVRALAFLGALASRLRGASLPLPADGPRAARAGEAPSLRGLTELWQGQAGALDVLARWNEPVKLAAPRFDFDAPERYLASLGALLAGAFRGGRTLGQLVEAAAGSLSATERPLALALAATQLDTLFPPR